jgi:DNA-binding NarL/FixJ family response regulator
VHVVGTGNRARSEPGRIVAHHRGVAPAATAGHHLTFCEVGQRLYISQHTVKTQAISVYRKLGVSSRSQAVQRLQDRGLIGA